MNFRCDLARNLRLIFRKIVKFKILGESYQRNLLAASDYEYEGTFFCYFKILRILVVYNRQNKQFVGLA